MQIIYFVIKTDNNTFIIFTFFEKYKKRKNENNLFLTFFQCTQIALETLIRAQSITLRLTYYPSVSRDLGPDFRKAFISR